MSVDRPKPEQGENVKSSALGKAAFDGLRAEIASDGIDDISEGDVRKWASEGIVQVREKIKQQGHTITSFLAVLAERQAPGILKKFYPRIIQDTSTHYSAKEVGTWLAWGAVSVVMDDVRNSPHAIQCLLPAMQYLVDHRMPLLFIAPKLFEAVSKTDFHDEIEWTTLPLPYEHGIFVLPRGALVHPIDGPVSFIVWSRVKPGDYKTPVGITVTLGNTSFSIVAMCSDTGTWYDSTLNAHYRPTLQLGNLFFRGPDDALPEKKRESIFDGDLEEGDAAFLEQLGRIAFGTIMAINARPGLVTHGKCEARVPAKKNKPAREFWSPNIVGRDYQTKVSMVGAGGSHASPRMHFRRGHFRAQPVGEGRRERKTIWIEPMLVGAE